MLFDLQRFNSGEDEGLTIDQALDKLNGVQAEPIEEEQQPETVEQEQPEVIEEPTTEQPEQEEVKVEQPTVDFTAKVKFKANGQEVEKSIQELINDAQLASNYNRRMQEMADKEKAFNAALSQTKQPDDPAKQFEELNNKVTLRAMQMLGINNPDEFMPDPTGIMGNKAHYAAYQKAILEEQIEQQSIEYQRQQEQIVDNQYYETVNSFQADPEFQDIYKHAVDSIFLLPQKGQEGIKEFQEMYGIYQKVQLRERHWEELQRYGQSTTRLVPFTAAEVKKLNEFYNYCKNDFKAKKTKEQVKAQVPKSVPIKPTVKVESTAGGDPVPKQKVDFKKLQSMDIEDIAKLL